MEEKPQVQLSGNDGNAFAIMGACQRAYKKHYGNFVDGPVTWDLIHTEMVSGDYDHLLATAMKYFDVN